MRQALLVLVLARLGRDQELADKRVSRLHPLCPCDHTISLHDFVLGCNLPIHRSKESACMP